MLHFSTLLYREDGRLFLEDCEDVHYYGSHSKESDSRKAKKKAKRDAITAELESLRQEAIGRAIQVDEIQMVVPAGGVPRPPSKPELVNRYLAAFGRPQRAIGPATQPARNPYVLAKRAALQQGLFVLFYA